MSDRKNEPHTIEWIGGTFPSYRGEVNTERAPTLDPGQPAKVASNPTRPLILSAEGGPRVMVRAIIANLHPKHPEYRDLTLDLMAIFGGYTCYDALGGWRAENGETMQEPVTVFEVSFPCDRPDRINTAVDLFAMAGRAIGERWIHIEVHSFNARHVQVNS